MKQSLPEGPAPTTKLAPAQKKRKGITTRRSCNVHIVKLTQANKNGQFQLTNKQSEKEDDAQTKVLVAN
jgi:hypothetical protein